jgi:hypothetical protein
MVAMFELILEPSLEASHLSRPSCGSPTGYLLGCITKDTVRRETASLLRRFRHTRFGNGLDAMHLHRWSHTPMHYPSMEKS